MLLNFSAENYKSIRARVNLDLTPSSSIRRFKNHVITNRSGAKALRGSIIYGSNASGKSNLIKAISYAQKLALNKAQKDVGTRVPQFKYQESNAGTESRFEFEIANNGYIYAYGFILNKKTILEEWLYLIKNTGTEHLILERVPSEDNIDIKVGEWLDLSSDDVKFVSILNKTTPKNHLFLKHGVKQITENSSENDKLSLHINNVIDWLENKLAIIYPESKYTSFEKDITENPDKKDFYIGVLKAFDTGINDIGIMPWHINDLSESLSKKILSYVSKANQDEVIDFMLSINNSKYNIQLDDNGEIESITEIYFISNGKRFCTNELSDGTQRLMDIIPAIYEAMRNDVCFFIDELDRSLHSLITKAITELFFDESINVKGQLVFTTHETSIMDQEILRRDELWLVQKERDLSSVLYPLTEYNLRSDKKINDAYLGGLFGAVIPYTNSMKKIKDLLWQESND